MAKVTKEKSDEHHEAMIVAASRLYRERGFDGIGVTEIMNVVGLTQGAFYGHFASKDALCAAALIRAFQERWLEWEATALIGEYIDSYLSASHRDRPGTGCPIPTFGPQIKFQRNPVQKQFARGVARFTDYIADRLPGGKRGSRNVSTATAILSAMVGGVVLARSTACDRAISGRILSETRSAITAKFGV